jgi:hypothetical protein
MFRRNLGPGHEEKAMGHKTSFAEKVAEFEQLRQQAHAKVDQMDRYIPSQVC